MDWDSIMGFIGDYGDDIVNIGTGVWDTYNQVQNYGAMDAALDERLYDPWGPMRPGFQDKMTQMTNNPDYMYDSPAYKFAAKGANREMAKSGHFHSPNRQQKLFDVGMEQYNQEWTRNFKGGGGEVDPNMQALKDALAGRTSSAIGAATNVQNTLQGVASDPNEGKKSGGLLDLIVGLFNDDSSESTDGVGGESSIKDWLGDLGVGDGWGDQLKEWGESLGEFTGLDELGDLFGEAEGVFEDFKGFTEEYGLSDIDYGSIAKRIAAGEDPKEVMKDEAIAYAKDQGKEYLEEKATELFSSAAPDGVSMASGTGVYADASLADVTSALLQAGMPITEGTINMARMGGTLAEIQGVASGTGSVGPGAMGAELGGNAPTSAPMGAGATAGAAVVGLLGSYLATTYIDDNPVVGFMGGLAGGAAGGALGGAVFGAGGVAAGAGGAAAGAAGAMAASGPLAIAAAVYVIGSGIYGVYKSGRQRSKDTKDYYRATNQMMSSDGGNYQGLVDDPTGQGYGQGYMFSEGGNKFFAPKKYYESVYAKLSGGEYLGQYGTQGMQGAYASYYNPNEDKWYEGKFSAGYNAWDTYTSKNWVSEGTGYGWGGEEGDDKSWAAQDERWQEQKTSYFADRKRMSEITSAANQTGEGGGTISESDAEWHYAKTQAPASQGGEGAGGGHYTFGNQTVSQTTGKVVNTSSGEQAR